MQKLHKNNGFTIIEVVLVLAIAGLIFLMVFIALPALQRSQADTQRRSDASRFLSQITNWQTNHRGNVPTGDSAGFSSIATLLADDNGNAFSDPSGTVYSYTSNTPTTIGQIQYLTSSTCGTDGNASAVTGQTRKVSVSVALSKGTYCTSN